MLGQWCLVCTLLQFTDYWKHQRQYLSLDCIQMILTTVCMGVNYLTGTVAAPQNDEKGLRRFRIVWSHILQYQKGGVWPVFLITP